jgi:hypothetical protein
MITDNPPDFINEDGIKWWKHDQITKYSKDINAIGYIVESEIGVRSFIVINKTGIIAESTTLEGIGLQIDMINFINKSKEI